MLFHWAMPAAWQISLTCNITPWPIRKQYFLKNKHKISRFSQHFSAFGVCFSGNIISGSPVYAISACFAIYLLIMKCQTHSDNRARQCIFKRLWNIRWGARVRLSYLPQTIEALLNHSSSIMYLGTTSRQSTAHLILVCGPHSHPHWTLEVCGLPHPHCIYFPKNQIFQIL